MKLSEWNWLLETEKEEMKTVHARAMAQICKTLIDAFPVPLETSFDEMYALRAEKITDEVILEAIDTAMSILLKEDLVTFEWFTEPGGPRFVRLMLTPEGYVFCKRVKEEQEFPKLFRAGVEKLPEDPFLLRAYDNFIYLLYMRDREPTWSKK